MIRCWSALLMMLFSLAGAIVLLGTTPRSKAHACAFFPQHQEWYPDPQGNVSPPPQPSSSASKSRKNEALFDLRTGYDEAYDAAVCDNWQWSEPTDLPEGSFVPVIRLDRRIVAQEQADQEQADQVQADQEQAVASKEYEFAYDYDLCGADEKVEVISHPSDLPIAGYPADLPLAGHPHDLPLAGHPADLPLAGHPGDLPPAGHPVDLPLAGHPHDLPLAGYPADLPLAGHPVDLPLAGHPRDLPLAGYPRDLPSAQHSADLPLPTLSVPLVGHPADLPVAGHPADLPASAPWTTGPLDEETILLGWEEEGLLDDLAFAPMEEAQSEKDDIVLTPAGPSGLAPKFDVVANVLTAASHLGEATKSITPSSFAQTLAQLTGATGEVVAEVVDAAGRPASRLAKPRAATVVR